MKFFFYKLRLTNPKKYAILIFVNLYFGKRRVGVYELH